MEQPQNSGGGGLKIEKKSRTYNKDLGIYIFLKHSSTQLINIYLNLLFVMTASNQTLSAYIQSLYPTSIFIVSSPNYPTQPLMCILPKINILPSLLCISCPEEITLCHNYYLSMLCTHRVTLSNPHVHGTHNKLPCPTLMYTVHRTNYPVQPSCTRYTEQITLSTSMYTVHRTNYPVQPSCTRYTEQITLFNPHVHCTQNKLPCPTLMYTVARINYPAQPSCTLYPKQITPSSYMVSRITLPIALIDTGS